MDDKSVIVLIIYTALILIGLIYLLVLIGAL